ncbi:unnamed protein product [Cuscuta campestris]|uniref:9-cis-epoxycarotenoid dioxygenase n=1 Tax=Cuscuta campestris TaxID=132261 RepID=A0A484N511_9ASTE|nr:unnamed protein product [Cuscuta campestris]
MVFNWANEFIDTFIDPPLRPSVDPRHVLASNFAPVDELPPTECEVVEGSLPPSLEGAYIRNGPNPQHLPRGPYHLFDGDGMLHAVTISGGKATFCSRYVRTYKYELEREAGGPVVPNFFSGFNGLPAFVARGALATARTLCGQYNPANGIGPANTSLARFVGELFALAGSDLPYAVRVTRDGDIVTVCRQDFGGKLETSMTAHPKIDPDTGGVYAFRYGITPPYLTLFRVNPDGTKERDVPILSVTRPSFMHDFAITKNYAVFGETQIEMAASLLDLVFRTGFSPVKVDPRKVPRIGVIRRDAEEGSEMRWNLDLGVINPAYVAKKNKYVYAGIGNPTPKVSGVVKLDISMSESDRRDCTVASRLYGPGCFGGEPFFVAKEGAVEEDEGYVLSYVHDEKTGESRFIVMDAQSPDLHIVAAVLLPRRVPYGFHGLFVSQHHLLPVAEPGGH